MRNPACTGVLQEIIRQSELEPRGQGFGLFPIKGPEGNIEYLLWLTQEDPACFPERVEEVVQAHHDLG